MPDKRPRVEVPYHRNAVAFEKFLRGFGGAPIRGERCEFAYDQSFDVRLCRLVVIAIRADISYVGISEADNLAGIAGIGENFLVTGEAGIENDFAAAARASACRTAAKDSSALERESRATGEGLRQGVLSRRSFRCRVYCRGAGQRTKVIHRPIRKNRFAVNIAPPDGSKYARVVGAVAVIAHHKVLILRNRYRAVARSVEIARRDINFRPRLAVHVETSAAQLDRFARKPNHALDKRLRAVERIPENNYVATPDRLEAIHEFVDEDPLLIAQEGSHAGAFDLHRLVEKNDDHKREAESDG